MQAEGRKTYNYFAEELDADKLFVLAREINPLPQGRNQRLKAARKQQADSDFGQTQLSPAETELS